MGLSERKNKQRIGVDPRNLTWSDDKSRFSYKHMQNLGWSDNSGIGRDLTGNPNHIAVVHRMDNSGIGMARARKEGDDQAAGAGQAGRGLEDVLKRLAGSASASASPSPMPASPAPEGGDEAVKAVRNRNASRQKHLNSKRLASASTAALAEILGVNASSLPASATPTPAVASPQPSSGVETPAEASQAATPEPEETESISKSNLSVSDYFRMRMREKMAARQAAGGPAAPIEIPLNFVGSSSKPVGGTAWEGSKMTFAEDGQKEAESSSMAQAAQSAAESSDASSSAPAQTSATDKEARKAEKAARKAEKAAKKAEKEARRAAKAEKKNVKAEATDATPDKAVEVTADLDKEKEKEKKRSKRQKEDGISEEKPKKRKRE